MFGGFIRENELKQLQDAHEINKKELEYKFAMGSYENELKEKYCAIPPSKLIEPDFQTIATALEDSKFCLTSETLRGMFASLIANACNSDKKDNVHPSFSSVLRQMSPLDAQTLSLFATQDEYQIANYSYSVRNVIGGSKVVAEFIFLGNEDCVDLTKQAQSISSLMRLGLLRIPDDLLGGYAEEGSAYHKTDLYRELERNMPKGKYDSVSVGTTLCRITPLGKSLISVCL